MSSSIINVIKDRRSVRVYSDKIPSEKVIMKVLEAAVYAPSAHNAQPWRFIIINNIEIKKKLAKAMAEEWDKDLREEGLPLEERNSLTETSVKQFTNSPFIIIPCLTMEEMIRYPDKRRLKAEYTMAVQSVAASIQTLLLAAHAEDLGACWFCAPLFCQEKVREIIKVPEDIEPQALITIGYPDEKPKPPNRKPLKSITHQNYWKCN